MAADARAILNLDMPDSPGDEPRSRHEGVGRRRKKLASNNGPPPQRGMRRELYHLLCDDNRDDIPPLIPYDPGFKKEKARMGSRHACKWTRISLSNPARKDGAKFSYWQRMDGKTKEYLFAQFNKEVLIHTYSDHEYEEHFKSPEWSREETDHLFDLAQRFDLRFVVMYDRWDRYLFSKTRSLEDLKERYYSVSTVLSNIRKGLPPNSSTYVFDADHERRRKQQLERLYARTPEQMEEINHLKEEFTKIQARRMEREKEQLAIQHLVNECDDLLINKNRKSSKNICGNKLHHNVKSRCYSSTGIKFRDFQDSNVFIRSNTMRLPANISVKKKEVIEDMLKEFNVMMDPESFPMPTEEICRSFNALRSNMALAHELKKAACACEHELRLQEIECQMLRETAPVPEVADIIDVVGDSPCDEKIPSHFDHLINEY